LGVYQTTGIQISLTRHLHLPSPPDSEPPLQISDTLTTVAFRGAEYTMHPGAEGVASLVFDVPRHARGVKGGSRHGGGDGEEGEGREGRTECLFEVRCVLGIKIGLPFGRYVHPCLCTYLPTGFN
jgi:hypothetical protein